MLLGAQDRGSGQTGGRHKFLWDGGTHGLANFLPDLPGRCRQHGQVSLSWRTPTYLLVTLAVLAALTVINAIVVGMGASLAGISSVQKFVPRTGSDPYRSGKHSCAVAITFGVTLFLAEMSRPTRGRSLAYGRRVRDLTWVAFAITIATILAGAKIMALIVWLRCVPDWLTPEPFQISVIHFANVLVLSVIVIMILAHIVQWRNVSKHKSGLKEGATPEEKKESETSPTLHALFYIAFLAHLSAVAVIIWLACRGQAWVIPFPPVLDWLCDWPTHWLRWLFGAALWD
jgi:hypothetical protein